MQKFKNIFSLYSDMDGVEEVEKEIIRAIESGEIAMHNLENNKILEKYSHFGATDTATMDAIEYYLIDIHFESVEINSSSLWGIAITCLAIGVLIIYLILNKVS